MSNIQPLPFQRASMLGYVDSVDEPFDVVVIGGGVTGVYTALDAASRGFRTALFEMGDFASGTSSRSTKLVHGGVRYMQQGRLRLVRESLRERHFLFNNAPHLVRALPIAVPAYSRWQKLKYTAGVKSYDAVARGLGLGDTSRLSTDEAASAVPGIRKEKLRGAIVYRDGQTDDARLTISIARTAASYGAALLNYARVRSIATQAGRVAGVEAEDLLTGGSIKVAARSVINATGVFTDNTMKLGPDGSSGLMRWSRGTHIVLSGSVLGGGSGLLVPETGDGRVIYALPWLGATLVGTTDVQVESPESDPVPPAEDIEFLQNEISRYLPDVADAPVLSAFTGIRPLVSNDASSSTASISRSHRILVSDSGLVTVTGGKLTTARLMAEQTVSRAAEVAGLPDSGSATKTLRLDGFGSMSADKHEYGTPVTEPDSLYGDHSAAIAEIERRAPELKAAPDEALPYRLSHAVYGVREEMAQTLEDVLARRTRSLFLNVDAAVNSANAVAEAIERHCDVGTGWAEGELGKLANVAAAYRSSAQADHV